MCGERAVAADFAVVLLPATEPAGDAAGRGAATTETSVGVVDESTTESARAPPSSARSQ
jgi:hypothetical protein